MAEVVIRAHTRKFRSKKTVLVRRKGLPALALATSLTSRTVWTVLTRLEASSRGLQKDLV